MLGTKNAVSTATQTPPKWVQSGYKEIFKDADRLADRGYKPYQGGFTGDQQSAFQNLRNLQGSSNGYFGSAAGSYNTGAGVIGAGSGAFNAGFAPLSAANSAYSGAVNPSYNRVNDYMNPYTQNVINATMANMQETNARQQQDVLGNAVSQRAMGGNRVGVAQAELARQQALANNQTIAGLWNDNYAQALGAAQAQQGTELQAGQGLAGLSGAYANLGQGLVGAGSAMGQIGAGQAGLGQTASETNLAQTAAQLGAGTQQQQFDYQQYLNKLAFPYQQQSWLSSIYGGVGPNAGGQTVSQIPQGNILSQILGGIVGGASLFSAHGGRIPARAGGGVVPYAANNDNSAWPSASFDLAPYASMTDTPWMSYIPEAGETSYTRASYPSIQDPELDDPFAQGASGSKAARGMGSWLQTGGLFGGDNGEYADGGRVGFMTHGRPQSTNIEDRRDPAAEATNRLIEEILESLSGNDNDRWGPHKKPRRRVNSPFEQPDDYDPMSPYRDPGAPDQRFSARAGGGVVPSGLNWMPMGGTPTNYSDMFNKPLATTGSSFTGGWGSNGRDTRDYLRQLNVNDTIGGGRPAPLMTMPQRVDTIDAANPLDNSRLGLNLRSPARPFLPTGGPGTFGSGSMPARMDNYQPRLPMGGPGTFRQGYMPSGRTTNPGGGVIGRTGIGSGGADNALIDNAIKSQNSLFKRGAKGNDVGAIQSALSNRGFSPGNVDGAFGPKTEAAVRAFQKANGLKVDGIVGPKTRAAMLGGGNNNSGVALPRPRPSESRVAYASNFTGGGGQKPRETADSVWAEAKGFAEGGMVPSDPYSYWRNADWATFGVLPDAPPLETYASPRAGGVVGIPQSIASPTGPTKRLVETFAVGPDGKPLDKSQQRFNGVSPYYKGIGVPSTFAPGFGPTSLAKNARGTPPGNTWEPWPGEYNQTVVGSRTGRPADIYGEGAPLKIIGGPGSTIDATDVVLNNSNLGLPPTNEITVKRSWNDGWFGKLPKKPSSDMIWEEASTGVVPNQDADDPWRGTRIDGATLNGTKPKQGLVTGAAPVVRGQPTRRAPKPIGHNFAPVKSAGERFTQLGQDMAFMPKSVQTSDRWNTGYAFGGVVRPTYAPGGVIGDVPYTVGDQFVTEPEPGYSQNVGDVFESLRAGNGLNLAPDMRQALLTAGAGMMASRSPFALQGIGEGTLKGVEAWNQRQQLERENARARSDIANQTRQTAVQEQLAAAQVPLMEAQTNQARYVTRATPLGMTVFDLMNPDEPPKVIPWGGMLPNGELATPSADIAEGGFQPLFDTSGAGGGPDTRLLVEEAVPGVYSETQRILTDAEGRATSAYGAQGQLTEMRHTLDKLPETGWLAPGTDFEDRLALAKGINTMAGVLGMNPLIDESEVAAGEEITKVATRLGFELTNTFGNTGAAQIVEDAISAVPSGANSREGAEVIINSLEAFNQRQQDYYQFVTEWARNHNNSTLGAITEFNKRNPPELYALSAYVPDQAFQLLRSNPTKEMAAYFNQKYGHGRDVAQYVLANAQGAQGG